MDNIDLCSFETVTIGSGDFDGKVSAWRFNELAVFKSPFIELWGLVHLPSGNNINIFWTKVEPAIDAMLEVYKLKNSWEFLTLDDLETIGPKAAEICFKHGGKETLMFKGDRNTKRLNGYDPL